MAPGVLVTVQRRVVQAMSLLMSLQNVYLQSMLMHLGANNAPCCLNAMSQIPWIFRGFCFRS
jgi:hypothetical protein